MNGPSIEDMLTLIGTGIGILVALFLGGCAIGAYLNWSDRQQTYSTAGGGSNDPPPRPPPRSGAENRIASISTPLATPAAGISMPTTRVAEFTPVVASNDYAWLTERAESRVPKITISEVAKSDNIAIIGPKGGGKTTILRTLLTCRNTELFVFDPDNFPGKWPGVVVGGGSDFIGIKTAFSNLHEQLIHRSKQLNSGEVKEGEFPPRDIASDEFFNITTELETIAKREKDKSTTAGDMMLLRITRGRKYCDRMLVVSHNDTLDGLGLPSGSADMKTCFDWFIYVGGMIPDRCTDKAFVAAALQMERPVAAFDTERNKWYLLEYDVEVMVKEKLFDTIPTRISTPIVAPSEPAGDEPQQLADGRLWVCKAKSLSPAEVIGIAAQIGRGVDKSTIVKAMPGYAEREHKAFAAAYELVRAQAGALDTRISQVQERSRSKALAN